jgi:hypothetical protein
VLFVVFAGGIVGGTDTIMSPLKDARVIYKLPDKVEGQTNLEYALTTHIGEKVVNILVERCAVPLIPQRSLIRQGDSVGAGIG